MIYFGDKLRALRIQKGLTQRQLADKMELDNSTISAYEKNAKYPSIEVLINLCRYFKTSADYLIGLSDKHMESSLGALTDRQVEMIL